MRRTGRVLFAFFYIWATVNVAGERSARAFHRIENWNRPPADQLDALPKQFTEALPHFGHAKKVTPAVVDASLEFTSLLLVISWRYEKLPDNEHVSPDKGEVQSSRAPPSLI